MSKLQVVHIITGLATGGAETMLYKLLSCTKQNFSCAPVVISMLDKGIIGPRIEALGIPVYSLNMRRGLPTPKVLLKLCRLIRDLKPNLLQGWMYHGNLAATLVSHLNSVRIPVVWNVRQSLYQLKNERRLTRIVIRMNAHFSHLPSAVIYNSHISAEQHESFGFNPNKTLVIPNGFDIEKFRPDAEARRLIRCELGISEETLLIGLLARYHPMKDHANFLHAAALLVRQEAGVHFVLAGRGIDRENAQLIDLVSFLNLQDNIQLLGERRDIPALTSALDIASSSSAWGEGFPNVIGEAMSCGVPCVVTDIGDSAVIVSATGRSVHSSSPDALVSAWRELIDMGSDGRMRLGEMARKRVEENYSLEAVAERYHSFYRDLVF